MYFLKNTYNLLLFISIFLFGCFGVQAGPAEQVIKLDVRPGATLSFLYMSPPDAKAGVILFAGYDGDLRIDSSGIRAPTRNFLVRSRHLFVAQGFAVVVIDSPSDNKSLLDLRSEDWHAQDVARVIHWMRDKSSHPVWLVGTSRGTISVVNAAARLRSEGPDGIVLTASVTERGARNRACIYDTDLGKISLPTLIVHHRDDQCYVTPAFEARKVVQALTAVKNKEYLEITGGEHRQTGDVCGAESRHGFIGVEPEVVSAIANWIKRY